MLISFIIPVYNVEKYLNECVDSILSQEFKDYEIILVDDGSTDTSGVICDEYAKKHANVIVEHKPNGGSSDARNVGIKLARGEYVLFVDSDDYIEKNSMYAIVNCLEEQKKQIDIVFLNASKVFPDGTKAPLGDNYDRNKINGKTKDEVLKHIAELPKYPGSGCTKLIRREIIVDNEIFFEKGIYCEDIDWTICLLVTADTFAYCEADYYCYRQNRKGSNTNIITPRHIECLVYIMSKWASKEMVKDNQTEINAFLAYEYMIMLFLFSLLSKKDQNKVIDSVKSYSWLLKYGKAKKVKMTRFLVAMAGVKITSKLLNIARS